MNWRHALETLRYVVAAYLAVALLPALAYWFLVHPFVGFWRRLGARKSSWLLGAFLVLGMLALAPFHRTLVGRDLGFRWQLLPIALPLWAVAWAIQRERKRHLKFRTLSGLPEIAPETHGIGLLTDGIYGRIRHPRYVEFTLGSISWALILNYLGLYVVIGVLVLALLAVVELEERELRQRYGQAYDDYAARVPRFVPRRVPRHAG